MIVTLLITIFTASVNFLIDLLPTTSLPVGVSQAISGVVGYAYQFDAIFPVTAALQVLIAALTFEAGMLIFRGVKWTIHLIRGN